MQFTHRWWAWVAAAALVLLAIRAMRDGARAAPIALKTLLVLQIVLGIATVLTGVAIDIAVAHQLVAALMVAAATLCAHRIGS